MSKTLKDIKTEFKPETRGGLKYKIHSYYPDQERCLIGEVYLNSNWVPRSWHKDGRNAGRPSPIDLIPKVIPDINKWYQLYYPVAATAAYVLSKDAGDLVLLKHALQKWKGALPENLAACGLQAPPFDFNSSNCALCIKYKHGGTCGACPFTGGTCRLNDWSPWSQWIGLGNPKPMIAAIERAIARHKKPQVGDVYLCPQTKSVHIILTEGWDIGIGTTGWAINKINKTTDYDCYELIGSIKPDELRKLVTLKASSTKRTEDADSAR